MQWLKTDTKYSNTKQVWKSLIFYIYLHGALKSHDTWYIAVFGNLFST